MARKETRGAGGKRTEVFCRMFFMEILESNICEQTGGVESIPRLANVNEEITRSDGTDHRNRPLRGSNDITRMNACRKPARRINTFCIARIQLEFGTLWRICYCPPIARGVIDFQTLGMFCAKNSRESIYP